jgi:hypothetical protein
MVLQWGRSTWKKKIEQKNELFRAKVGRDSLLRKNLVSKSEIGSEKQTKHAEIYNGEGSHFRRPPPAGRGAAPAVRGPSARVAPIMSAPASALQ